jgi:hypothetical protein
LTKLQLFGNNKPEQEKKHELRLLQHLLASPETITRRGAQDKHQ